MRRIQTKLALAVAMLTLLSPTTFALVTGVSPPAWGAWNSTTLASGFASNGFQDVAIDASGRIHVVWDEFRNHKYVTSADGVTWSSPLIGPGALPNIAVDPAGVPHICAEKDTPVGGMDHYSLIYETITDGVVTDEVTDATDNAGQVCHLVFDSTGRPHMTALTVGGEVRYYYKDTLGWHMEVVGSGATAYSGIGLAPDGTVHVAYYAGSIMHATRAPGGGWTSEVVPVGGYGVNLAVDPIGRPHITTQGSGEVLTYGVKDSTSWHFTIVDSDAPTGMDPKISIGASGIPQIAYTQIDRGSITRGHLKYASLSAAGWVTEAIDFGVAGRVGLKTDAQDRPHVAYIHWQDQPINNAAKSVRYAEPVAARAATLATNPTSLSPPSPTVSTTCAIPNGTATCVDMDAHAAGRGHAHAQLNRYDNGGFLLYAGVDGVGVQLP